MVSFGPGQSVPLCLPPSLSSQANSQNASQSSYLAPPLVLGGVALCPSCRYSQPPEPVSPATFVHLQKEAPSTFCLN